MKEFNLVKERHFSYLLGILFLFVFILLPNNTAHGYVYKICGGVQVCVASGRVRSCGPNGALLCGCPDGTTVRCGGQQAEKICGNENCGLQDSCTGTTCESACTLVNATWTGCGASATCGGNTCGGSSTCPGSAPSCATGSWSYPSNCPDPSSCGQNAFDQYQQCTGGNGVCTGSAGSRRCAATAPCPTGTWSYPSACPASCGQSASTQWQQCTGGNGVCSGPAGNRLCGQTAACVSNVNGGWSGWSPSACPTACGNGPSTMYRYCNNPSPSGGGVYCSGSSTNPCGATSACAGNPDLIAGNVTPLLATAGSAQVFSSTITNNGSGSTGIGFTNLFQTSPDTVNSITDYPVGMSALASGNIAISSQSINFASVGPMYIRACADKSNRLDANGVISESNENNNCSSWLTVNIANGTVPVTSLNASQTVGAAPLNINLTWSSTNAATGCTATGGTAVWNTPSLKTSSNASGYPISGLMTPTVFNLFCTNVFGNSSMASVAVNPSSTTFTVTVRTSQGGTVKSTDGLIDCGASCIHVYNNGDPITFVPYPQSTSWKFVGWTGDCISKQQGVDGHCTLTVDKEKTVTAIFTPKPVYIEY